MSDRILKIVLAVAAGVFGRDVTPADSFFGVRGDSLHAVELGMRIEEQLGVELDPLLLFDAANFAALAAALAERVTAASGVIDGSSHDHDPGASPTTVYRVAGP